MTDQTQTTALKVGDRVRIKATTADNWIDPKIARRARLGRAATISLVVGTALPEMRRHYRLKFDCEGRERPFSEVFHHHDIEAINDVEI